MARYAKYQPYRPDKDKGVHPIWRGIGCVLWILVPLMSYALTVLIVNQLAKNGVLPTVLLGYVQFPEWVWNVPILAGPAHFIGGLRNLWAMLISFFLVLLILVGLTTTAYAMAYNSFGPPRYTEVDAPPTRHKASKRSR